MEHFKALTKPEHGSSAIADHIKATEHIMKRRHFEILASGKTDYLCKIKDTLFIKELNPALNANLSGDKALLINNCYFSIFLKIVFLTPISSRFVFRAFGMVPRALITIGITLT